MNFLDRYDNPLTTLISGKLLRKTLSFKHLCLAACRTSLAKDCPSKSRCSSIPRKRGPTIFRLCAFSVVPPPVPIRATIRQNLVFSAKFFSKILVLKHLRSKLQLWTNLLPSNFIVSLLERATTTKVTTKLTTKVRLHLPVSLSPLLPLFFGCGFAAPSHRWFKLNRTSGCERFFIGRSTRVRVIWDS